MSPKNPRKNPALKWIASGAAAVGIAVGAAGLASAATGGDSNANTNPVAAATAPTVLPVGDSQTPPADANRPDPASMTNGPGETLLTGTELSKVTAAAQAAEPGATIVRAETDSNGHTYEVHLQLADGSYKTLYFNASYAADGTDTGFGAGPAGRAPADANTTATTNG
jgi:hypothetical protein